MMKFKGLFLVILLSCCPGLHAGLVHYTLNIIDPQNHIAEVLMELPANDSAEWILAIPAWAPGRYVIYNFSKNIFDVQARDEENHPVPVELLDKQTWRVHGSPSGKVRFQYKVYANTLDGTFSRISQQGASINGAAIFMYLKEHKDWPVKLSVQMPRQWQVVCPLDQDEKGDFLAENYDILIDSPLEMGTLAVYDFEHLGKPHQLVFQSLVNPALLKTFIRDLKKVITQQAAIFGGDLPYQRYVFFFHLDPNLEYTDGMEHLNSCRVLLRIDINQIESNANTNDDYDNLIWLSAHEFFHTWNGKRLRPAGLGPFDYEREIYSDCLWIVEGFTSYFAYLSLLRSGIYTKQKLYSEFAGRISRYENSPAKSQRSLREVCLLTWLFKGRIPSFERTIINQTTYSYYYKGLIVGMLLDLKLRQQTDQQVNLDSVMHEMYKRFYLTDRDSYYLPGEGYRLNDFKDLIKQLSSGDWDEFFSRSVYRVESLDYHLLQTAGLELIRDASDSHFMIKEMENPNPQQLLIRKSWLGQQ